MAKRLIMENTTDQGYQEPSGAATEASSTAKDNLVRENSIAEANTEDRYAHMFADWDLMPPQILVRRVNRK